VCHVDFCCQPISKSSTAFVWREDGEDMANSSCQGPRCLLCTVPPSAQGAEGAPSSYADDRYCSHSLSVHAMQGSSSRSVECLPCLSTQSLIYCHDTAKAILEENSSDSTSWDSHSKPANPLSPAHYPVISTSESSDYPHFPGTVMHSHCESCQAFLRLAWQLY